MITPTTLPTFPNCPSYGFTSRPTYLVKIVEREGGHEKRDRKWEEPLHFYDGVPMGPRPQVDIETIATFYHAMGGKHRRFRFLDYADYRSAFLDTAITELDQAFEVLGGGSYQMVKTYASGSIETIRRITLPIGDTVVVANNSGVLQPSDRWTIDEDTGILTVEGSFVGTPASWGGEFYVPCRFAADFAAQIVEKKIFNADVSLRELRADE